MIGRWALLLILSPGLAGAAGRTSEDGTGDACARLRLVDVATAAGIGFVHDNGAAGDKHLPETMGAGLAWIDYDGDGWKDLYAVQSGPYPPAEPSDPAESAELADGGRRAVNRLYRNLGGGRFLDVTEASGAGDRGCGQGATAADLDGDGAVDLYVTNIGPDRALLNLGNGRFEEASERLGLGLDGWSSSAALADGDLDGDLDLYVSRYLEYRPDHGFFCGDPEGGERRYCDPSLFVGARDAFYVNDRAGGEGGGTVFRPAADEAGIAPADGRGLGVLFVDLDDDGWPDLYVANDLNPNFLFANQAAAPPRFADRSLISGTAVNREGKPEAGMGVAIADVDGDLDPDLAVTNFDVETNTLYRNLGGLGFADVSAASGFGPASFNRLAFGLVAADLDGDGFRDYYAANGHIFERPPRQNVSYRQPDQVFLGDGTGAFSSLDCDWLGARPTVARGLAAADFDNDGDVDLGAQENAGPLALLENRSPPAGWLGLDLRGAGANSQAIGARVTVDGGPGRQVGWVIAGDSYQSSSERRLLFGLGEGRPAAVEVRWPGGRRQRWLSPPGRAYLVVVEPR